MSQDGDFEAFREKKLRETARETNLEKVRRAEDDGMFFGPSPTEKSDLRETKDKKGLKLDDLDLNAVRDADAPKKVGTTMRLIDMAMTPDDPPPKPSRPPARRPGRPPQRPPARPARPARPGRPNQPARPGRPNQPARPSRPNQPPRPGRPNRPGRPGRPPRGRPPARRPR